MTVGTNTEMTQKNFSKVTINHLSKGFSKSSIL